MNCLFLITGFKLLKLLSVVCGFGWQTNVCNNYIQNICSVQKRSVFCRKKFCHLGTVEVQSVTNVW